MCECTVTVKNNDIALFRICIPGKLISQIRAIYIGPVPVSYTHLPIQHIKLNQQLITITEEIEELKSRKEQLIFQAECSTDKDMTNLSKKYDQMNNNLDILDSQDISLKKQLEKDAAAFREEKFRPEPEQ